MTALHECSACRERRAKPGDLLCHVCWRRLPQDIAALSVFIARLAAAALVPARARQAFDGLVIAEARRRAGGDAVPNDGPAAHHGLPDPAGGPRRGAVTAKLLAALPTRAHDAITREELAARAAHPLKATGVWCSIHVGQLHSELRAVPFTLPGQTRPRFRYWREVARG